MLGMSGQVVAEAPRPSLRFLSFFYEKTRSGAQEVAEWKSCSTETQRALAPKSATRPTEFSTWRRMVHRDQWALLVILVGEIPRATFARTKTRRSDFFFWGGGSSPWLVARLKKRVWCRRSPSHFEAKPSGHSEGTGPARAWTPSGRAGEQACDPDGLPKISI